MTFECTTFHGITKIIASLTRGNIAEPEDIIYNES